MKQTIIDHEARFLNPYSQDNFTSFSSHWPIVPWQPAALRRVAEMIVCPRLSATNGPVSPNTYHARIEQVRGWAELLLPQDFDCLMSINTNDPKFTFERGRRGLKAFGAWIDRRLLGNMWREIDSEKRSHFFAFPETSGGELHYHLLVRFPPGAGFNWRRLLNTKGFNRFLTSEVQAHRYFPRGDVDARSIRTASPLDAINYVLGDQWKPDLLENICLSSEFHGSQRRKQM